MARVAYRNGRSTVVCVVVLAVVPGGSARNRPFSAHEVSSYSKALRAHFLGGAIVCAIACGHFKHVRVRENAQSTSCRAETPRRRGHFSGFEWRPRPELNRGTRFCRPLRNHSATWPSACMYHAPFAGCNSRGGAGLRPLRRLATVGADGKNWPTGCGLDMVRPAVISGPDR